MTRTALFILMTVAAQPIMSVHATPTSRQKLGYAALTLGIAAVIGSTIAYVLFTKSDGKVCKDFTHGVQEQLNAAQHAQNHVGLDQFDISTIPPLFSRTPTHPADHTTILFSSRRTLKANVTHSITKRNGRHFHKLTAHYLPATDADRAHAFTGEPQHI